MAHLITAAILVVALTLSTCVIAYKPIEFGGDCTHAVDKCKSGLACVGPSHRRRCKKLKLIGEKCGQDPYWVCESYLTCQRNYCRISQGSECTKYPNWCSKGLQCVGTKHYKQCEKPIKVGKDCLIEPWWVCASGLVCHHNKCRIPQGGECTNDPKWCKKGLQCVGTKYYKQCEKPIKLGGSCLIEPWWVCQKGLVCSKNKCKLGEGQECTKNPEWCAHNLHCVGDKYYKRCEKPLHAGGSCGYEKWWVCGKGLTCEYNYCKIPHGKSCLYNEQHCAKGLHCVGNSYDKRCEKPIGFGGRCGIEPWWVCGKGLICGGVGKARRCIHGRDEGRPCRPDNPKMTCESGLQCKDGFCRYY